MTTRSANILRKSLNSFALNQAHNSALKSLILGDLDNKIGGLKSLLEGTKGSTEEFYTIKNLLNRKILNNYYTKLSSEIRASFEKSLYFTASRIPA